MTSQKESLLELLLDAKISGVTALSLTAVLGTEGEASIATTADHLFAVGLTGQSGKGGLNHTTTKAEDQMESGLLLDVVVRKGAAIFELLSSEDQALLVRGDTYSFKPKGKETQKKVGLVPSSSLLEFLLL